MASDFRFSDVNGYSAVIDFVPRQGILLISAASFSLIQINLVFLDLDYGIRPWIPWAPRGIRAELWMR